MTPIAPNATARRPGKTSPPKPPRRRDDSPRPAPGTAREAPQRPRRPTVEADALRAAAEQCNVAFGYCTTEAGDINDLEELLCLVDCAQLCAVTADFAARGSEHSDDLRGLCAEVCKCVEEACEEYPDDEVLTACADSCRAAYNALSAQASPKVS